MDSRLERWLRPIAAVVLFFFTWISIEPWNYAAWAQTPSPKVKPASNQDQSAAGVFEESLRNTKGLIEEIDQDLASGKDLTLSLQALRGHKQALEDADPQIRAEFAETGKFLKEKKLPAEILKRHADAVADYDQNYKKL